MAGHVIGDPALEARAHVFDAQHVDEEIRQLVGAPARSSRALLPDGIIVKQLRILQLDHRRAGAGGRDDERRPAKAVIVCRARSRASSW